MQQPGNRQERTLWKSGKLGMLGSCMGDDELVQMRMISGPQRLHFHMITLKLVVMMRRAGFGLEMRTRWSRAAG